MAVFQILLLLISIVLVIIHGSEKSMDDAKDGMQEMKKNTVVIAILVRNKAHVLPYFLTCLERLDYPKDRLLLW